MRLRVRLEQGVRRFWARPSPPGVRWVLAPFARLVAAHARRQRAGIRRAVRPPCSVLVVGNLTVGGSGKTPVVVWAAERVRDRGGRVAVAVRSYRGRTRVPVRVEAESDPRLAGDEALLLARRLAGVAVAAAPDRTEAVRFLAEAFSPALVIVDDGLQHPSLARDRVWLCVDGAYGLGNGRVLPLGPLREPLDAEVFAPERRVLIKEDPTGVRGGLQPPGPVRPFRLVAREAVRLADGTRRPLAAFRGASLLAYAGIARPESFFALLEAVGLAPVVRSGADHESPPLAALLRHTAEAIMMTEKDAVKIASGGNDPRLWYVPVEARFDPGDARVLETDLETLVRDGAPT